MKEGRNRKYKNKAQTGALEVIDFTPAAGAERDELAGTNYERKYIKDKRDIYTTVVRTLATK